MDSKICTKCEELKPLNEYHSDKRSSDGKTSSCGECNNNYSRKRRATNTEDVRVYYRKYRATGKGLENLKEYSQSEEGKAVARKSQQKWKENNRHKRRAHSAVNYSIRTMAIEKQPCAICGETQNIHAHHADYEKPLNIKWLCAKHHHELHREERL